MIGVLGKWGSGKSAIVEKLSSMYEMKKLVSYTTRPQRKGETDGIDYYFIDKESFLKKKESGFFSETREYDTVYGRWYYGTSYSDCIKAEVSVLSPEQYISLTEIPSLNICSIYLNIDTESLFNRLIERGESINEIVRRLKSDDEKFSEDLIIKFSIAKKTLLRSSEELILFFNGGYL